MKKKTSMAQMILELAENYDGPKTATAIIVAALARNNLCSERSIGYGKTIYRFPDDSILRWEQNEWNVEVP